MSNAFSLGNSTPVFASTGINGAAATARFQSLFTSSVLRWSFGADVSAESGSSAGSAWVLNAYDDTGAFLATPLTVVRATGIASFVASPLVPTATTADNTTKVASTAFVKNQSYLTTSLASTTYATIASPTLTGTPFAPTAAIGTSTTQIATTAFVINQGYSTLASPTFTGVVTLPSASIAPGLLASGAIGIAAAGTTQATATVLTADMSVVSTSTASTALGVVVPVPTVVRTITVVNKSANSITVYPSTGVAFDGLAINIPISLAVGAVITFKAISATLWYSSLNMAVNNSVVVGASGVTPSVARIFMNMGG